MVEALKHQAMKSLRRKLAMFLVVTMVFTLLPSMGAMAAGPSQGGTKETEVSVDVLYDEAYYAANNPDVFAAFGNNSYLLRIHYDNYGVDEGRKYISPILDVRRYRAANPDLDKAFGDNWVEYLKHYLQYGAFEIAEGKRSSAGVRFDPMKYLTSNVEVWRQTGGDLMAVIRHYIDNGRPQGDWVIPDDTAPSQSRKSSSSGNKAANDSQSGSGSGGSGGSTIDQPGTSGDDVSGNNPGDKDDTSGNNPNPGDEGDVSGNNPGSGGTGDISGNNPDPDKPTQPVEHTHTKDSFDESGNCTVENCDYTLSDLQRDCKIPHGEIEIGHYCVVCGFAGTKEPGIEHTKDSEHLLSSFNDEGVCMGGCGLTLAEFQKKCPDKDGHGEILQGETCEKCGYEGTKVEAFVCSKAGEHENLHKGESCDVVGCDYQGLADHEYDEETGLCSCGVRCSQDECPKKAGHGDILKDDTCSACGYEGMKESEPEKPEEPEACENETSHATLHKGQTCEKCDYEGIADHVWDEETGECTCGAKCSQDECPRKSNHDGILQGETCICGYEGVKAPEPEEPEEGEQPEVCENEAGHAALHKGQVCEKCDFEGTVDHEYDEETGLCSCGAKQEDSGDPDETEEGTGSEGEGSGDGDDKATVDPDNNVDPTTKGDGGTGGGVMSGHEDGKDDTEGQNDTPEELPDAVVPEIPDVLGGQESEKEPDPDREGEELIGDDTDDENEAEAGEDEVPAEESFNNRTE